MILIWFSSWFFLVPIRSMGTQLLPALQAVLKEEQGKPNYTTGCAAAWMHSHAPHGNEIKGITVSTRY